MATPCPSIEARNSWSYCVKLIVAAGRRPHELTVDLIYTEIQQGSRTTINVLGDVNVACLLDGKVKQEPPALADEGTGTAAPA